MQTYFIMQVYINLAGKLANWDWEFTIQD